MAGRKLKNRKKLVIKLSGTKNAVLAAKIKRLGVGTGKKPVLKSLDKEKTLFQFKNLLLDPDEKEQWISVMDQELREIRSRIDEESYARQTARA